MEELQELEESQIQKDVASSIVTLISQANLISTGNSVTDIANQKIYDVDSATEYIGTTETLIENAKLEHKHLKEMKESHFWTIGRNKAKAEKTQEVLENVVNAVDNNALATKSLFNCQTLLAGAYKKIYSIGVMGIAANRIVVREIKKRLAHASQEELSELARHELEQVLEEVKKQQSMSDEIESQKKRLSRSEQQIETINTELNHDEIRIELLEQKTVKQAQNHVTLENDVHRVKSQLEENHSQVLAKIKAITDNVNVNQEKNKESISAIRSNLEIISSRMQDSYIELKNESKAHNDRLNELEKKTFLDSSYYKIIVGLLAFGAFAISLINILLL